MVGNTAARFPKQTCHIQLMLHGTNISSLVIKKKITHTHLRAVCPALPEESAWTLKLCFTSREAHNSRTQNAHCSHSHYAPTGKRKEFTQFKRKKTKKKRTSIHDLCLHVYLTIPSSTFLSSPRVTLFSSCPHCSVGAAVPSADFTLSCSALYTPS